eukprot:TRINITY_DN40723_c0_g1_i1.p1 TRINITY_DN40723_c0_g1~~TRINITY_DN40723_c0_g1_i1.p1  ORF type:complete len:379 (+),score=99.84 TRINITY_DN40723_c0_g1_i1:26-1138(+)
MASEALAKASAAFEVKTKGYMGGISPAVEAFRTAASMGRVSANSSVLNNTGDKRLTPLELDAQLQVSELMYHNLLHGKQVQMTSHKDMDAWYAENLGEDWLKRNKQQRKEMERLAKECGENTPMWVEALSDASDLAFEVFSIGKRGGEQMAPTEDVDREIVIDHLESLIPKVRISHYARCGAGDRSCGLRALVGTLWHFPEDSKVTALCATCLRLCLVNNETNRDSLVALSQPLPPEEREALCVYERGWSFLRVALEAFCRQAGGEAWQRWEPSDKEKADPKPKAQDSKPDPKVAVMLAECLTAAKAAPALQAQLVALSKELPADACKEQRDVKEMLPNIVKLVKQLSSQRKDEKALMELQEMLKLTGAM